MKKILFYILFQYAVLTAFAQPKLFINENNFLDLDTLYPGIHKIEFQVYNRGDKVLEIESLGASCGCTSYHLENYTIPAYDSSLLTINIDLKRASGQRHNFLYFKTNDPDNLKLDFPIDIFVYRDLILSPKRLPGMFNVKPETNIEYILNIKNIGDKVIILENPFPPENEKFEIVSFTPEKNPISKGENIECKLILKFSKKAEMVYSIIKIPTNSEVLPTLDLEFIASMKKEDTDE